MGQTEPITNGTTKPKMMTTPDVDEAPIPVEKVQETAESEEQDANGVSDPEPEEIDICAIPARFSDGERKEILDGFRDVITGHVESRKVLIRDFPRAQAHMEQVCDAIYKMVEDFLTEGIIPKSTRPTEGEIDNSIAPNKPFQSSTRKRPGE